MSRGIGLALLLLAGCSRADPPAPTPEPSKPAPTPASASARPAGSPLVLARGVRFLKPGPDEDVARLVRGEREKAASDGRDLVVYVGAKWCEPCQRFHSAAQRGELDADFPELSILEFDLDEDRDRLTAASYDSKMIPLFVLPDANGRGGARRFEGSVKGERAMADIAPRLRGLLSK